MARLLLDENFPLGTVPGLAAAGYDVLTVADTAPSINDLGVLALARSEGRCLLTFDADFGDLIFQRGELPPPMILLFRLHPVVVADILALALTALQPPPDGHFVVVTRDGMRRRPFSAGIADGAR